MRSWRVEECDTLQTQLQRVEVKKDQLGEKIQSLKTLLEIGMDREVAIRPERDQLQSWLQVEIEQV